MYRNARAEMVRAGLNLVKVATEMNVRPGTVSGWLTGKYEISVKRAKEFKKVVKSELPLEKLFERFEEAN